MLASDIEALPEPEAAPIPAGDDSGPGGQDEQKIHFCTARDGTQLAYARVGNGPPLVKTGHWMTHLEFDFENPIWRLNRELSRDHALIRYDARGNGLSDRNVEEISSDAFVGDLESVSRRCRAGTLRPPGHLSGMRGLNSIYGAPSRARFAFDPLRWVCARLGKARSDGSAKGASRRDDDPCAPRLGPGESGFSATLHVQFMPGGSKEQADWLNELQRISISPENAVRYLHVYGDVDVSALLAEVAVPTLVLHARDDARVPFDLGWRVAAGIPGARFVSLPSRNHLILEDEPAFPRFLQELRAFLAT